MAVISNIYVKLRNEKYVIRALFDGRRYNSSIEAYVRKVLSRLPPEVVSEIKRGRCPFCGRHFTMRGLRTHLTQVKKRNYCAMIFMKLLDKAIG